MQQFFLLDDPVSWSSGGQKLDMKSVSRAMLPLKPIESISPSLLLAVAGGDWQSPTSLACRCLPTTSPFLVIWPDHYSWLPRPTDERLLENIHSHCANRSSLRLPTNQKGETSFYNGETWSSLTYTVNH